VLYQYAEYHIAQSLRRYTQSNITGKVSCLSGCNQILKICTETCGKAILDKFNYLPLETDDIFKHIRSFASEDRNHVCQMLSMFPHVKTKQNMCAVAYTTVPTSLSIFFSQRRRWSLGATTNDLLLTYLPGINIFERISAVVNCMNYVLSPFICIASVILIKSFIEGVTYLMLMLGIIMIIPQCYYILIPLFQGFYFRQSLYFYLSYIVFLCLAIPTNMCIFLNSVFNMDVLKWGKTRSISAPTERVGTDVIIQVNVRTTYSDDDKETDC
jgi:chitin synthase